MTETAPHLAREAEAASAYPRAEALGAAYAALDLGNEARPCMLCSVPKNFMAQVRQARDLTAVAVPFRAWP
jgi:hypothetical protein